MSSPNGEITHVSDTALMVAACRAHETELQDAFVKDPFAARLAGERGFAILAALPYSNLLRLGIAIGTRFVDELLLEALSQHPITTIVSVGCGLDTRPWRLDFPSDVLAHTLKAPSKSQRRVDCLRGRAAIAVEQ